MTCEVAVANRLGIALAADSAATFTQSDTGARTYATGANKIFQLTEFDPVGCMIFNNSALSGIPWELVIKAYRAQCAISLATIQTYCDDFVDFVGGTRSSGLLPASVREQSTFFSVSVATNQVIERLSEAISLRVKNGETAVAVGDELYQRAMGAFQNTPIQAPLTNEDLISVKQQFEGFLHATVTSELEAPARASMKEGISVPRVAEMIIETLFRAPFEILARIYTGIVIAGFGQEQHLPSCVSVRIFGFIGGKLLCQAGDGFTVEHTGRDCYIQPFATRSMVETFLVGASSDVYGYVNRHFHEATFQVCRDQALASGQEISDVEIEARVKHAANGFMNGWANDVTNAHYVPLLKVVGGLSLEEIGELADTLVMLESLKEKVTYRTQSVGGPVDVALITKADGLVWIKRKLYFDASLNHRYLARVERKHRGER